MGQPASPPLVDPLPLPLLLDPLPLLLLLDPLPLPLLLVELLLLPLLVALLLLPLPLPLLDVPESSPGLTTLPGVLPQAGAAARPASAHALKTRAEGRVPRRRLMWLSPDSKA